MVVVNAVLSVEATLLPGLHLLGSSTVISKTPPTPCLNLRLMKSSLAPEASSPAYRPNSVRSPNATSALATARIGTPKLVISDSVAL